MKRTTKNRLLRATICRIGIHSPQLMHVKVRGTQLNYQHATSALLIATWYCKYCPAKVEEQHTPGVILEKP